MGNDEGTNIINCKNHILIFELPYKQVKPSEHYSLKQLKAVNHGELNNKPTEDFCGITQSDDTE
jgi:hypothetical protein